MEAAIRAPLWPIPFGSPGSDRDWIKDRSLLRAFIVDGLSKKRDMQAKDSPLDFPDMERRNWTHPNIDFFWLGLPPIHKASSIGASCLQCLFQVTNLGSLDKEKSPPQDHQRES